LLLSPTANRTIKTVLASVVLTAALLFSAWAVFHVLSNTNDQVDKNTTLAMQNAKEVKQIKAVLFSEKVCSEHNQGAPCQALFNRLAKAITRQQRFRLACDVLAVLDLPTTDRIRQEAHCPSPLEAP
jgi:type II secretory pathway component PulJ